MSRARWSMAFTRSVADVLTPEQTQACKLAFLEALARDAEGEHLYVPSVRESREFAIRELLDSGMPWRLIAKRLRVSYREIAATKVATELVAPTA